MSMLWNIRSDRSVLLSGGKSCIRAETPATHEDAKISFLNEACIHCFLMCVFQLLHALFSAWPVFLALHSEGFWLECYLSERCGLSKLKQVNVKMTVQSWSINTSHIVMVRRIKLIAFSFNQGTQVGWTLAPLQQVSQVRLSLFVSFVFCFVFFFSLHPLMKFSLLFLQGVLAQEWNDNLFPPTLPPLRTAALMLALEAPRAHPPAAWRDYIWVTSTTSRPPSSVKVSYVGFVLLSYWLMLERLFFPSCVLFKISLKSTSLVSSLK